MPRKTGIKAANINLSSQEDASGSEICNICNLEHATEECPLVNTGLKVDDTAVPSKAVLTLPDALEARQEDGKWHVIAKQSISNGVQFGPVDAPKSSKYNTKCSYPLKIFAASNSKQQVYFLDTSDEDKCNWMVLVPFSNDPSIRNCICYQLQSHIYFTVLKDIVPGEPLIVGYSPGYLAKLSVVTSSGKDSNNRASSSKVTEPKSEEEGSTAAGAESEVVADVDHDYTGAEDKPEKSDSGLGIRRSTRRRKVIEDDIFVFETVNTPRKGLVQDSVAADDEEAVFFADAADDNSGLSEDPEYGSFKNGNSSEEGAGTKTRSRVRHRDHFRNKSLRLGAVLALDEWKCKFCPKIDLSIPEFASHLIEHYKSVGAAKTEKLRLLRGAHGQNSVDLKNEPSSDPEEESVDDAFLMETSASTGLPDNASDVSCDQLQPQYPYVCDICVNKKIFNRAEYLIRHLRNHTGEFYCSACNQTFTKEAYLDHDCPQEVDSGESFACSECTKTFSVEKKLRLHLEWVHSKAFECSACHLSFAKNEAYENHRCNGIRLVDKNASLDDSAGEVSVLRQCDLCGEAFLKAKDLEKHLKSHGEVFYCATCNKELSSRNVNTHSEICKAVFEFAQGTAPSLQCPKCSEEFDNRDAFRYHVATHTHPAMCPVCNLRLPSTTLIRAHNCSRFQCDGCQQEFVTLISLKKHITAIHGEVEFYCFECALPFVTQNGYASHRGCGAKDHIIPRKKFVRKPKEEGMYVCEVCGATYTKWSSLKTHRYTHGPKRFVCNTCGKSFHRREMLADHEYVHQEAQFECNICQKKVKSKKSLDVHMQIHKGNKRFKCDQCDKAFCQKINLITHKMIHLPPEKKGFSCVQCGKKFASKEYLGFHMEGHTKGCNEVCNICGRAFIKAHMLNQHKKTAHGNHTYACEFCNIVVRQKHSLTRHLKKRHMDVEEQWKVKGYLETRFVPGDSTYDTNERCKTTPTNMNQHVVTYVGTESEDTADNTITFEKVDILTEVVDVDATCEVETEEITFASENMIIPDSSNMMILQVKEGGEIVLTLAPPEALPVAGTTVVEGMIVEDGHTLHLQ